MLSFHSISNTDNHMNKKRIFYLDFIRAVAAFIIVSCHISAGFQYSSKTNALFLYDTVNKGRLSEN